MHALVTAVTIRNTAAAVTTAKRSSTFSMLSELTTRSARVRPTNPITAPLAPTTCKEWKLLRPVYSTASPFGSYLAIKSYLTRRKEKGQWRNLVCTWQLHSEVNAGQICVES